MDIFKEVDEALRYDRVVQFWQKYKFYVIGSIAFILLCVGTYVAWGQYDTSQRMKESDQLLTLYKKIPNIDSNQERTDLIKELEAFAAEARRGYALLARLQQAALMAENNEKKEALELYYKISQNSEYPLPYRGLALMEAGLLGQDVTDTVVYDHLFALIEAVAANDNNPWQPFAKELIALKALRDQNPDKAKEILKGITENPIFIQQKLGVVNRATSLLMTLEPTPIKP